MSLGDSHSSKYENRYKIGAVNVCFQVMQFCNDFDMNGPMLSGLAPPETMERLHKYQAMYDKREEEVQNPPQIQGLEFGKLSFPDPEPKTLKPKS